MDRRNPRGPANLAVLVLVPWLLWAAPSAAEWVAVTADIGRTDQTAILHGGVQYASLAGSELNKIDPGLGFEGGAAFRLYRSLSLDVSVALGSGDVDGQIVQLLDNRVRDDGRSGTVQGSVDFMRLRAGVRLDTFHRQGWRLQPYVLAAAVYSKIDVTITEVDGAPPTSGHGFFDDSQIGALARMGIEIELAKNMGLDVAGSYEVLEFPTGTASLTSITGGLFYRI